MSKLFEQSTIAGIELKNRIIRSATHEGLAYADGRPMVEKLIKTYVKLAQGGVGAIVTGYVISQQKGRTFSNITVFDSDSTMEDYRKIINNVREYGTPLIMQIGHGGGLCTSRITGEAVIAPSKKIYPLYFSSARAMTEEEIKEAIGSFTLAIVRAQEIGFNGVQLHACHGSLLYQFLSPGLNKRQDRWGGSTENRFRIINEIAQRAREKVGSYPILVKFSAYDDDKGGIRLDEGIRIAELFEKAGIDAIEISCGGHRDYYNIVRVPKIPIEASLKLTWYKSFPSPLKALFKFIGPLAIKSYTPLYNYNVEAAREIKSKVNIPVIVVGGIRKREDMERIIDEEKADFVSMSRPFIIEPDIVNKMHRGEQLQSRCINCGYCLSGVLGDEIKCYYGKLK